MVQVSDTRWAVSGKELLGSIKVGERLYQHGCSLTACYMQFFKRGMYIEMDTYIMFSLMALHNHFAFLCFNCNEQITSWTNIKPAAESIL